MNDSGCSMKTYWATLFCFRLVDSTAFIPVLFFWACSSRKSTELTLAVLVGWTGAVGFFVAFSVWNKKQINFLRNYCHLPRKLRHALYMISEISQRNNLTTGLGFSFSLKHLRAFLAAFCLACFASFPSPMGKPWPLTTALLKNLLKNCYIIAKVTWEFITITSVCECVYVG